MGGAIRNPYNVFLLGIGPMINASLFTSVFANLGEKGAWGPKAKELTESWKNSGAEVRVYHGIATSSKACMCRPKHESNTPIQHEIS